MLLRRNETDYMDSMEATPTARPVGVASMLPEGLLFFFHII